jgi:hypothetical protein
VDVVGCYPKNGQIVVNIGHEAMNLGSQRMASLFDME